MALPDGFPAKAQLEKEGYETVEEVSEATDAELQEIDGIGAGTLAKIREQAPFKESEDETGSGATSGKDSLKESVLVQQAKLSKNQVDPITKEPLAKGLVVNERGTITATSEVDHPDFVSPERVKAERKAMLQNTRDKFEAILGE